MAHSKLSFNSPVITKMFDWNLQYNFIGDQLLNLNKIETIQDSFQDFYQTTILSKDTDPNSIYDLLDKIRHHDLVTLEEINEWSELFVSENRDDSKLQPILNQVIERWRNLSDDEDKELSKSQIRSYCKLFSYLSMINQFDNVELYRYYLFFEYHKRPMKN